MRVGRRTTDGAGEKAGEAHGDVIEWAVEKGAMDMQDDDDARGLMSEPAAQTREVDPDCYVDQFPHTLPHRNTPQMRPCGHYACDPHTITYYGTGAEEDARVGDYCMVCYERTFPGRGPDRALRAALAAAQ